MKLSQEIQPQLRLEAPNILAAGFQRVFEGPVWGKLLGAPTALLSLLTANAFTIPLLLTIFLSFADYIYGRRAAKLKSPGEPGAYDPVIARRGGDSKMIGFILLLSFRILEYWANHNGILPTNGAFATFLAVSMFAREYDSLDHHRQEAGGQPLPGMSLVTRIVTLAGAGFKSKDDGGRS